MTTKLRLFSDLHLEFANHDPSHIWTKKDTDKEQILILAGDIDLGDNGQWWMDKLSDSFKYVIRILGNHEGYQNDYYKVIEAWKAYELSGPKNFHFLHNDQRIIEGVRYLGGTMWTDFNDGDINAVLSARVILSDYRDIRVGFDYMTPEFATREHDKFMDFLLKKFEERYDGKTVVITHHSPGNAIKRSRNTGYELDHAYYANLEKLIGDYNVVDLWCHGHLHTSEDYLINETRVVCNPYGYHSEKMVNKNFNKNP